MNKSVAIITARGGSKRIPNKNIKEFFGKPIIVYSIQAALKSHCFDEVMVSTDSEEIARIAGCAGARVPFLRSADTANDWATTTDVLIEVLDRYKEMENEFEYACCIYPTAPFVSAEKLVHGMELLFQNEKATVMPVVQYSYPPQRSFSIQQNKLVLNWPEYVNARSQDLPLYYHDAGQFYCFKVNEFLKEKKMFREEMIPLIMPESEVQDIDSVHDWVLAEMKYSLMKEQECNDDK